AAVRGLFRFLADQGRLAADPTLGIATPKTCRKLPAHLTLDDIDRLLATPRGDTLAGLRDRALLEVLYSSRLRVSELTGLHWARAPPCAPSRSCSATRASPPRSATRTSTSAG